MPLEPAQPGSKPYNWHPSCDIFSLGATIRHLMTLNPPDFPGPAANQPFPAQYSQGLQHIVNLCLDDEPSKRPTAIDILDACISHCYWEDTWISPYGVPIGPWFTKRIRASWNDCVRALRPGGSFGIFEPGDNSLSSDGLATRAIGVLSLDRQTEASSLSMLMAGTSTPSYLGHPLAWCNPGFEPSHPNTNLYYFSSRCLPPPSLGTQASSLFSFSAQQIFH